MYLEVCSYLHQCLDVQLTRAGVFGATRGIERLLALWEKKNIKCTWFTPGHTIETFPEQIAKIRDAGHEMYEMKPILRNF
jgi:hypothetical protein